MTPETFWSHIDRSGGPDACWPWHGAKKAQGYGHLQYRDENNEVHWTGSHRMALTLHLGRPLSKALFVIHTCDNPPCCNPAHLVEDTPAANTADMMAKGRNVVVRGEDSHNAKLTPQAVREIRALADVVSSRELARRYGVRYQTIAAVIHRRVWTHVA